MALWSWWQRAAEETAQSWCKFGCWILSWHSKDNRFFSTTGNTCRKGTDVATSSMPWKSMCQGLGSVYCPLCVCVCVCVCVNSLQSCQLFVTLWTVARLCHGDSLRILKWVAMPSSRVCSLPRDRTYVFCSSCIAGGFFTAEPLGKPILPTI